MKIDVRRFGDAKDQKAEFFKAMKSALPKIEIMRNSILVGTYIRPGKTKGGIILGDQTVKESQYQGKVGLILKIGPDCWNFPEDQWRREKGEDTSLLYPKVGDWIFYNVNDAWECGLGDGAPCRIIRDEFVRGVTTDPSIVW